MLYTTYLVLYKTHFTRTKEYLQEDSHIILLQLQIIYYNHHITNKNSIYTTEYMKARRCSKKLYDRRKQVNQSHYRPEVPRGFQEVKVPRLRDNDPGWW